MNSAKFHVHFNSRREAHPVFHMTPEVCKAALARRPDLAGKVRMSTGWDLANAAGVLKTATMLVTSMQVPREELRTMAPRLSSIHLIGAGVEYLRPFDWVPDGVTITNNRGIHHQKAGEYILMCVMMLNNRIPTLMNAQSRREWLPMFTDHLSGKVVLIIGVGHLGGAGARGIQHLPLTLRRQPAQLAVEHHFEHLAPAIGVHLDHQPLSELGMAQALAHLVTHRGQFHSGNSSFKCGTVTEQPIFSRSTPARVSAGSGSPCTRKMCRGLGSSREAQPTSSR